MIECEIENNITNIHFYTLLSQNKTTQEEQNWLKPTVCGYNRLQYLNIKIYSEFLCSLKTPMQSDRWTDAFGQRINRSLSDTSGRSSLSADKKMQTVQGC